MILRRHFDVLFTVSAIVTAAAAVLWYIALKGIGHPDSVAQADDRIAGGAATVVAFGFWALRWLRSQGIVYMINCLLSWNGQRPPAQTGPLSRLT